VPGVWSWGRRGRQPHLGQGQDSNRSQGSGVSGSSERCHGLGGVMCSPAAAPRQAPDDPDMLLTQLQPATGAAQQQQQQQQQEPPH
jgi:hypothetical protein